MVQAEKTPVVDTEQEAAEKQPSEMELDELRDIVNSTGDQDLEPTERDQESETVEEDGDDAEADADEDSGDTETVGDDDDTSEADTQEQDDPEPEPDLDALRQEELEARARHFEAVAGRHAGRLGFLEQQNKQFQEQIGKMNAALTAPRPTDDTGYPTGYDSVPNVTATEPLRTQPDPNAQFLSQQAVVGSLQSFMQAQGISYTQNNGESTWSSPEFAEALAERAEELKAIALSGDAQSAAHQASLVASESLAQANMKTATKRRQEAEAKRADQAERLKKNKRAQSAASQSSRPVARKRNPSSLKEIGTKDLRRLVDSRSGLD